MSGLFGTVAIVGVGLLGGSLGLALKQADPVFAGNASRDPELQYFAGSVCTLVSENLFAACRNIR